MVTQARNRTPCHRAESRGEGYVVQYPIGTSTGPTGGGYNYIGTEGSLSPDLSAFSANLSATIDVSPSSAVGMPTFLAMCPDGTVINRALMEFSVAGLEVKTGSWSDDGSWPSTVVHTGGTWEDHGPVGITVMAGLYNGNRGMRWVPVATASGATATAGKSFVADVTSCAQALLRFRASGLCRAIAFVPSPSVSWIGSLGTDLRGALQSVRGSLPTFARRPSDTSKMYQVSGTDNAVRWSGVNHGTVMWLDWTYPASVSTEYIQDVGVHDMNGGLC